MKILKIINFIASIVIFGLSIIVIFAPVSIYLSIILFITSLILIILFKKSNEKNGLNIASLILSGLSVIISLIAIIIIIIFSINTNSIKVGDYKFKENSEDFYTYTEDDIRFGVVESDGEFMFTIIYDINTTSDYIFYPDGPGSCQVNGAVNFSSDDSYCIENYVPLIEGFTSEQEDVMNAMIEEYDLDVPME